MQRRRLPVEFLLPRERGRGKNYAEDGEENNFS
jgi:hypothetical protein